MAQRGNVAPLRAAAWVYGRELRDHLLSRYCKEYGIVVPPPPAHVIDELLTDFMGVKLRFDPLPTNVFAQTNWVDGDPVVTINSRTRDIKGVKYDEGVKNVAKFHEAVHVERDLEVIKPDFRPTLPGFESPSAITCYWRTDGRRWSAY